MADGAYKTFFSAVSSGAAPNLLLLRYDRVRQEVLELLGIRRQLLSPLSVIRRKPLSPTARRAGWVGCNIDLRSLPPGALIPVVTSGRPLDENLVQDRWQRYSSLLDQEREPGWLRDTLTCIQRLGKEEFCLTDLYAFETSLTRLHPRNHNVRPKIRQQLQALCRQGLLERLSPGLYRTIPVGRGTTLR